MYPRNNASPPRIAVGSIYLIADGTLQTSGASIAVRAEGGAEGAGAGTTAYGASGTIYYTPTQAETNYTAFCVTAYKASCTSASVTVVTTAESTAGKVSLGADQSGATVGTVTTNTDMRGTDSAALASVWTAARAGALTDWIDGGRLDVLLDGVATPGAQMDFVDAPNATALTAIGAKLEAMILDEADATALLAAIAAKVEAFLINEGDATATLAAIGAAVKTAVEAAGSHLALILEDTGTTIPVTLSTISGYVDCLPVTLDGSTFTSLPAVVTDAASRTASKADVSALALASVCTEARLAVLTALTSAAATKIALSAGTIVSGTVSHDNTAATTTVFYASDITEATADHYNGRIVIFTSGALQYQATDITDYALESGEGKLTVTALTEAPADNSTFIIV